MKTIISSRASTILYNWLKTNNISYDVIIPANICETVPAVYMKSGINITWLDISNKDWNISKKEVLSLIKDRNYILHYNHTYGKVDPDAEGFFVLIKAINPKTIIVDDKCLCVPEVNGYESVADLTLFSTGPKKIVDLGYGGFAYTINKYGYKKHIKKFSTVDLETFEQHVKLRHQKVDSVDQNIMKADWIEEFDDRYSVKKYFSNIEEKYKAVLAHKNKINEIYKDLEKYSLGIAEWRYNILANNKDECINALFNAGCYCSGHYMSLGNGYFFNKRTPNANYLYEHVVNLFNDFYIDENTATKCVEVLLRVVRGR